MCKKDALGFSYSGQPNLGRGKVVKETNPFHFPRAFQGKAKFPPRLGSLALAMGLGNRFNSETNAGTAGAGVQQQLQEQVQEFVDVDGDGVCDNYEAGTGNGAGDGTGECDEQPLSPLDGTGNHYGRE